MRDISGTTIEPPDVFQQFFSKITKIKTDADLMVSQSLSHFSYVNIRCNGKVIYDYHTKYENILF